MKTPKLADKKLAAAVAQLPGWKIVKSKLHRDYVFPDFVHAFGFMATCATSIQAMNHHPEWFNVYNRVTVDLTTHDSGGITKKDVELARHLEDIARKLAAN